VTAFVVTALLLPGAAGQAATPPAYVVALSHGADRQRDWRLSFFEVTGDGLLFGRNNELALSLAREPQGLLADWPRGLVYLLEQPARRGGARTFVGYAVDPSGFPFVFGKAELTGLGEGLGELDASGRFLYTTKAGDVRAYAIETTTSLALTPLSKRARDTHPAGEHRSQEARLGPFVYRWTPGALRTLGPDERGTSSLLQLRPFARDRTVVSLVLLRPPD
jgi:hypothetical protein